jgi:hypothetical protein
MKKNIISRLSGMAAVLACATSAYATPTLYITDGTTAKTVVDQGVGDLDPINANNIVFVGSVGNWTLNTETGQVLGNPGRPDIDLNFTDTYAAGATTGNTITIAFLSDGYTTPAVTALGTIGGTLGSGVTLTYAAYEQTGSTAATTFGGSTLNLTGWTGVTHAPFTTSPFAGTLPGLGLPPAGGSPYEVLQVITITAPTGGRTANQSSGDAHLAVPDGGATLMLLGSSLTALAFFRRSAKNKA